jgi:hypothetical protein
MYFGSSLDDDQKYEDGRVREQESLWQELKNYHYRTVSNTISLIGTGTFVLSLNFLGSSQIALIDPLVLIGSWIQQIFAVLFNLISHQLSVRIAEESEVMLLDYRASNYTVPRTNWSMDTVDNPEIKRMDYWRGIFDKFAVTFLILGSIWLVSFVSINLKSS